MMHKVLLTSSRSTVSVIAAHKDCLTGLRRRIHSHVLGGQRGVNATPCGAGRPSRYVCNVEAEPLHRYARGGYHPVHLGDELKHGRYRILHKLGWGGYSTVWLARDQDLGRYVAVKISTADYRAQQKYRQLQVMRTISESSLTHPGSACVVRLLDRFELNGPNGSHMCLVLEPQGPSVADVLDVRFVDDRLPAEVAKKVARQVLLALDYLHQQGIGHGDIHTRNITFPLPISSSASENELSDILGNPEFGQVRHIHGDQLEPGMPSYIIRPSSYPSIKGHLPSAIKIIDYGESFLDSDVPATLSTPLAVRAPEIVLKDDFDHAVDIWGMGCLLFELFTGQPPFDVSMLTPGLLMGEMEDLATDRIPERWVERARCLRELSIQPDEPADKRETPKDTSPLQQWLEEVYFDECKNAELGPEDVRQLGDLISRMLWFEPSSREPASSLLKHAWLSKPS